MDLKRLVASRHPQYAAMSPTWQYYADAAEAAPDYPARINPLAWGMNGQAPTPWGGYGRYLVQHALEGSDSFLSRLNRAAAVDIVGPALDLLCGAIGQPDTVAADIPKDYQEFWDNCDLQGSSLLTFMSSVRRHAATYGLSYLFADSTKAIEPLRTQADAIRQGVRSYVREIEPLDLLNWRLDPNGAPLEVLFRIKLDATGSLMDTPDAKDNYEYRFWTKGEWFVIVPKGDEYVIAEQGVNPLGAIPIAPVYHRRLAAFKGESLLKQSARYMQLLTCWLSDLDKTLEMQSFSQATLTSTDEPAKVGIGSSTCLHLHPERREGDIVNGKEEFAYVSPDAAPIQMLLNAFGTILDLANNSMSLRPEGQVTSAANAESGISRAWRWHSSRTTDEGHGG